MDEPVESAGDNLELARLVVPERTLFIEFLNDGMRKYAPSSMIPPPTTKYVFIILIIHFQLSERL
jgi:hypothetical protein